ncbi:sulfite dehydrogenase [Advenella incenata]|jgi:sulfane dehydrogenase subunit SoxC
MANESTEEALAVTEADAQHTRRQFLRNGVTAVTGVLAGSAGLSAAAAQSGTATKEATAAADNALTIPPWTRQPGALVGSRPYGKPSEFESGIIRHLRKTDKQYFSSSTRTPLQELDGIITPNGLFYERHHNGIPDINPVEHRLVVHGLVNNALSFTLNDIRRFPSHSQIYFLECSGNPGYAVYGKTAAEVNGLVSCAEWTGVPLKTVLNEAGLKTEAKWVIAEGADGAGMTRSIPLEKCLDDAMLVYSQNGERLRPEQGYPLRLLLPGYEGNMSIKWLRRLQVADQPVHSREETSKYTDILPNGKAREFTFVMEAKSIITSPSGGQQIEGKGFHEIRGIAWSGKGRITKVEISVDEGKTWQPARLQTPVLSKALTRFLFAWEWNGEPVVIQSRATDETGYIQPTLESLVEVRGVNNTYHNNAITPWRIASDGKVTHARA